MTTEVHLLKIKRQFSDSAVKCSAACYNLEDVYGDDHGFTTHYTHADFLPLINYDVFVGFSYSDVL